MLNAESAKVRINESCKMRRIFCYSKNLIVCVPSSYIYSSSTPVVLVVVQTHDVS